MKRIISLWMTAALMLLSCGALSAEAAPDSTVKYQSKKLTAYLYSMDEKATVDCLFRDDLPSIPYISAVDYLNQLYTVAYSCSENADGTYTVSDANGEMIVDVEKDTVHFEDYETFTGSDVRPYLEDETADYLADEAEYEIIGEAGALDLDLAAYGIDLTASGGAVYFPLSVINDIYGSSYHAALYLDGALYFIDVMEEEPYYDDSGLFSSVKRDKAVVDYTYRELCFVMDHFYGCPSKAPLAQDIQEKGFDRAIEEHDRTTAEAKQLLLSDDLVDYCYGLLYLDMYMDDGGHTMLSYGLQVGMDAYDQSAFTETFMASMYDYSNGRLMTIYQYLMDDMDDLDLRESLEGFREQWFRSMTEVKTWDEAAFYRSGSTGVFTFDEFKDAVVYDFKWALDYAQENGLGSFIIDLSLNGGGSTAVCSYMLSVICDFDRVDFDDRLTGTRAYEIVTVDRNLDGEFDALDDEVAYDLRFAVLTSKYSFSAANLLSCLLKYNAIPVLGENSGGGACSVSIHYDPAGYAYAMSDSLKFVDPDGEDFDAGARPDCVLPGAEDRYVGFYHTKKMDEGIAAYYENRPDPLTPSESGGGRDQSGAAVSLAPYMLIGSGAIAGVCLIAFVVILISGTRSARKKKRI